MNMKLLSILAGISGMGASVSAGLPYNATDPSTLDTLGRWPLTVILGAVCVICVYFMYKQSKDNADRTLALVEGERLATEHRITNNSLVAKELTENNAKVVKELADSNSRTVRELSENHAKEIRVLLDELEKHGKKFSTG
jgi:hypothetical protein